MKVETVDKLLCMDKWYLIEGYKIWNKRISNAKNMINLLNSLLLSADDYICIKEKIEKSIQLLEYHELLYKMLLCEYPIEKIYKVELDFKKSV